MKVIALTPGFYPKGPTGHLRDVGSIFEMTFAKGKDGKPKVPKWVKVVKDEAKAAAEAAAAIEADAARDKEAALLSSGGAAARAKIDSVSEELVG